MHTLFTGVLPEQVFAPRPPAGVDLPDDDPTMVAWERATRALYAEHADEVAAVVVEPVLQGAGGMHAYSPYVVRVLRRAGPRARRAGHLRRDRDRLRAHRHALGGRPAAASCRTS